MIFYKFKGDSDKYFRIFYDLFGIFDDVKSIYKKVI